MITNKLLKKVIIILLSIIFVFVLINTIKIIAEIRRTDVMLKYYVNKARKESDSIIKSKNLRIKNLLGDVYALHGKINVAQAKIDSLNAQKQKVQYIYINKLKEIDTYSAKQVEEYWKNEIK